MAYSSDKELKKVAGDALKDQAEKRKKHSEKKGGATKKPALPKLKDEETNMPPPGVHASGKGMQAPQAGKTRIVVKGETLSEIAAAAGVTVAAIKAANPQIKGTTIVAGKKIKIPKKVEK